MNDYPTITPDTTENQEELLRAITRERTNDISDFNNIKNKFTAGRIVGKVPTGASDIDPSDRVGDTNFDYASGFLYRVVDNAGTAVWARVALDTAW